MAETQLGLLEQTASQGLDELCEVVADATSDLADGLVGSAGNTQVLLNSGREGRLDLWNGRKRGRKLRGGNLISLQEVELTTPRGNWLDFFPLGRLASMKFYNKYVIYC